jgi:hypothetical protein
LADGDLAVDAPPGLIFEKFDARHSMGGYGRRLGHAVPSADNNAKISIRARFAFVASAPHVFGLPQSFLRFDTDALYPLRRYKSEGGNMTNDRGALLAIAERIADAEIPLIQVALGATVASVVILSAST